MDDTQASISDPQCKLSWFASSAQAKRGFCSHCGSSLFFTSARWPGELHITRASLHTPIDTQPMAHVFVDTQVDWVELTDHLPRKTEAEVS
ncbi:GFA family protein [Shewanella sp. GXUN23E]|uniref:GFA family protein n=1 Tax=Shewanella sp. GXUN23E TaxID=3422498 RepID=UPI003D7CEFEE